MVDSMMKWKYSYDADKKQYFVDLFECLLSSILSQFKIIFCVKRMKIFKVFENH
jgi:hypothetical protein